jgi:hypothetical protein
MATIKYEPNEAIPPYGCHQIENCLSFMEEFGLNSAPENCIDGQDPVQAYNDLMSRFAKCVK